MIFVNKTNPVWAPLKLVTFCLHAKDSRAVLCKNPITVKLLSKVAFIILSPSTIEASNSWLMRQFELYAIISQPIALMSVAACQASGRLYLFP